VLSSGRFFGELKNEDVKSGEFSECQTDKTPSVTRAFYAYLHFRILLRNAIPKIPVGRDGTIPCSASVPFISETPSR